MSQNTYFASEAVRITADVNILGTLVNANTITLYVTDADGNTTTYSSPTNTGVGMYFQDFTLPSSPAIGRWSYYWETTGFNPNQNGVSTPQYFYVRLPMAP